MANWKNAITTMMGNISIKAENIFENKSLVIFTGPAS
jgi:hypothetical protein